LLLLVAKIADLGVAKVVQATARNQLAKVLGTADFMPPEALMPHSKYEL